ncbi:biopolymer transport protein ExbB [Desulfosarcina sp. BuS5]|uniref:MotA/TolQ/ExbB proton channel family protein n=1 Tax=Desulfosarcina sp. BuS5 TaxID=933262 RepID=UPI000550874B|nr:MotA/TolQ/ExbB proton channel family protein [Desulfosarcina sp. BuS5]WDN88769.1 biopolymer transport protein ExbB [Desulfosarcina sp. BuS5]
MKIFIGIIKFILVVFVLFIYAAPSYAEDLRIDVMEAEKKRAEVLQKAKLEKENAAKEAEESRKKILADKNELLKKIAEIKAANRALEKDNSDFEKKNTRLEPIRADLNEKFSGMEAMIYELTGQTRIAAKDLDDLLSRSLHSALTPGIFEKIKPVLNKTIFPGMNDIKNMTDILFDEIKQSGEVNIQEGTIINRSGEEVKADILTLGNFTAAYRLKGKEKETGFLIFSDKSRRLFALSKLPGFSLTSKIKKYMEGKSDAVPIDMSHGAALRQLTHKADLKQQIMSGGPIVWPILGIGVLAFMIIIERFIFLKRVHINADKMMTKVNNLASQKKWDECINLCEKGQNRPVPRVLLAGINSRDAGREDMENVLQEAILREIPRIEKFMSTLGMLAAIAPLLGLLGTVTGMINTFHAITFYGTGDPKMMSGGISEALTTTMLGLGVAIPIMLFHTFLGRNAEIIIGQMEEKAVALTNIVCKGRVQTNS